VLVWRTTGHPTAQVIIIIIIISIIIMRRVPPSRRALHLCERALLVHRRRSAGGCPCTAMKKLRS
jgi:hypothetical protein